MRSITWKELLENPSFAKGEIVVQEHDKIYGGPIREAEGKGHDVYFHLLWGGHYDMCTDTWTVAEHETTVILNKSKTTLVLAPDGHIVLQNPDIIVANMFPEGTNKIDPSEVEGLDLDNLPKPQIVVVD